MAWLHARGTLAYFATLLLYVVVLFVQHLNAYAMLFLGILASFTSVLLIVMLFVQYLNICP